MDTFLQQVANGLVLGGAYALVALGLFLVFNALHVPNFAHGELFALGAYFQYFLVVTVGVSFTISVVLVVLIVAIVGVLMERAVFQWILAQGTLPILIASLALAIVIQQVISLVWGQDHLAVPVPMQGVADFGGVRIANYRLVILGVVLVAGFLVSYLVYRTSFGRSLRAIAQNREIAELSGISVTRITIVTFAISGGLAGLAGAMLAPTASLEPTMGFHPMLVSFAVLVAIGGGSRIYAVIVAAFVVAIGETLVAGYVSNTLRTVVVFMALVCFLVWRPDGARRRPSETKVLL